MLFPLSSDKASVTGLPKRLNTNAKDKEDKDSNASGMEVLK